MSMFVVIGIDCPGCGTVKDIRIPFNPGTNSLSISKDRDGKIVSISMRHLEYVDVDRVVYVYIEEAKK